MNSEEQTKQTYNRIAKLWSDKHPDYYFWQDELDYLRTLKTKGNLVDVGCASGRDAQMLVEAGYSYLGVDYSESMIDLAREKHPERDFEVGDMYDLSAFGRFDVVWAIASVLHIKKENVDKVLASLKAALKEDGVLVVALKMGDAEDIETFDDGSKRLMVYWKEDEFRQHLESAGLKIDNVMHKNSPDFHWMTFFCT